MRAGHSRRGAPELKAFPLSPALELYGGEPVESGYGRKPYRCPFHGDSQASATVDTSDPENEWFNCHAADCPKGNAVQIIMKQENIPYGEAVQRAAEISGEGHTPVRKTSGRSGRMAGGSRAKSGVRTFKRTWRSE